MSKRISRGTFVKGLAGFALLGGAGKLLFDSSSLRRKLPACRVLGPSVKSGHRLRDGEFSALGRSKDLPREPRCDVVIVGGGISGLSAAWWLKKKGVENVRVLELEPHVGGNSASGSNAVSAFPWGAHYVPLPNSESQYVRAFFEELGIITGSEPDGRLIFNNLYLCHDPQERLLKDGSFQEGLVPRRGLQPEDKEQLARFFALMKDYRYAIGSDGRPAFAIPLDLSSSDRSYRDLDGITMAQWLTDRGFNSKPLLWYVNYCCRDDYGSTVENVSAWAGIHYFAGRRGTAANAEPNSVLTWPEGNGFLVGALRERLHDQIHTGRSVVSINQSDDVCEIMAVDTKSDRPLLYTSDVVIAACPRFIAGRIVAGAPASAQSSATFAPWLVANVTVRQVPRSAGADLSWDNVSFNSPSLGYVVATHQNITTRRSQTVLTYYRPLSDQPPRQARRALLSLDAEKWCAAIVDDLEAMHPGLAEVVESVDIWPWGHGMVLPTVGYIWGDARARMKQPHGRVFFAHSDMSGISNFEEAQYQGVEAANLAVAELAKARTT